MIAAAQGLLGRGGSGGLSYSAAGWSQLRLAWLLFRAVTVADHLRLQCWQPSLPGRGQLFRCCNGAGHHHRRASGCRSSRRGWHLACSPPESATPWHTGAIPPTAGVLGRLFFNKRVASARLHAICDAATEVGGCIYVVNIRPTHS